MNACKQSAASKIIRCPKFQKRLTDNEFHKLVHEIDIMDSRAEELSKRVKKLIDTAVSGKNGSPDSNIASGAGTSENG